MTNNNKKTPHQVWMLVLRYFAGVMAWATIVIVNLALGGCTLYSYHLAGKLATVSDPLLAFVSHRCLLSLERAHVRESCTDATTCAPQAGQFGAAVSSQFAAYAGQDPTLVSRDNWGYIAYALTAVTGLVRLWRGPRWRVYMNSTRCAQARCPRF